MYNRSSYRARKFATERTRDGGCSLKWNSFPSYDFISRRVALMISSSGIEGG